MYETIRPALTTLVQDMVEVTNACDPASEDMKVLLENIDKVLEIETKNKPQNKIMALLTSPAFMGFIQGMGQVTLLIAFESTGGIVTSLGRNLIKK